MDEPAEVPGPSALDELLRGLAEEGELVDEGAITLDEAGARAKLQEYRLAEPEMWVTMAVRAAGWGGASRVRYRGGNDPELEIEGLTLEASDLESLSVHALVDVHRFEGIERSRAAMRRTLAIAVMGALETAGTTVIVESHADELLTLTMSEKGESVERVPLDEPPRTRFVRIVVDRPGLFASRSSRELALLRSMARYAPFEVLIAGSAMPRMIEARLPEHPFEGTIRFETNSLRGFCTRDESLLPEHRGKIVLVVAGVVLATRPLEDPEHAVIVHGEFAGDLSDAEVREDERYEAAMVAARDALERCLAARVEAFDPGGVQIHSPRQRRLVLGAVLLAALALVVLIGALLTRNYRNASPELAACRQDANACIEAGDVHRDCADRHIDACNGLPPRQHQVWAIEAYERGCEAGILESCHRMFEVRVHWLGGKAETDPIGARLRGRACELGSVDDCLLYAVRFAWGCEVDDRCLQVVRAAERACTLERSSECAAVENVAERFQTILTSAEELGDRTPEQLGRLRAALELAEQLKDR